MTCPAVRTPPPAAFDSLIHSDQTARMARGEIAAFEELYSYACPKFVVPVPESGAGADHLVRATSARRNRRLTVVVDFCESPRRADTSVTSNGDASFGSHLVSFDL